MEIRPQDSSLSSWAFATDPRPWLYPWLLVSLLPSAGGPGNHASQRANLFLWLHLVSAWLRSPALPRKLLPDLPDLGRGTDARQPSSGFGFAELGAGGRSGGAPRLGQVWASRAAPGASLPCAVCGILAEGPCTAKPRYGLFIRRWVFLREEDRGPGEPRVPGCDGAVVTSDLEGTLLSDVALQWQVTSGGVCVRTGTKVTVFAAGCPGAKSV